MVGKKRGRKPINRSKEYQRGYNAGWGRAMRKATGQIPITRKKKDKLRSSDWQAGLAGGLKAGRKCYGNGKGK